MTREEAAEFTRKLVARAETIVFPKTPKTINNIPVFYFEAVLSALRGPQPDPITGLVPCGCGGALKFERFNDGFFDLERIACECGIEITSGPGFCKPAWNRAMGWREKE